MPRTYKSKNVQTKKELCGEKNLPENYLEKHKAPEDDLMNNIIEVFDCGVKHRKKGSNWSEADMLEAVRNYFEFCSEKAMKPSKSSLQLWLGCSSSQYHVWQTEPTKYGAISEIITMANKVMETQYTNRGEKYPTFNMFLLKAGHNMVETNKVEITNTKETTADEIKEAIVNLGLDK